jgi:hypothetical protein
MMIIEKILLIESGGVWGSPFVRQSLKADVTQNRQTKPQYGTKTSENLLSKTDGSTAYC